MVSSHVQRSPHKAKFITDFLAQKGIKLLEHPPYLPDLVPCDFWLYPIIKAKLGDILITYQTIRYVWECLVRTINMEEFRATFDTWLKRRIKCIQVGGVH